MTADRREGTVLIVLLTVSTIVMLTIAGVWCVIGNKHYAQNAKHAEVQTMQTEEQVDARMRHAFLA